MIIEILLGLVALYCGGMWLWMALVTWTRRRSLDPAVAERIAEQTFRLGLCFVLAVGFLGVIQAL